MICSSLPCLIYLCVQVGEGVGGLVSWCILGVTADMQTS